MRPRAYLRCLAALLCAAPCGAQTSRARAAAPPDPVPPGIREGEQAHAALRPLEAIAAFESVLGRDASHAGALWRAAREAVQLGMLATERERRRAWYDKAESYARRSIEANPEAVDGHEWLAVAVGRLAIDDGPRTAVRRSEEARTLASNILASDSTSAIAHHVLGEWHAELMRRSGVSRWLARKLLGAGDFEDASWDAAERHLRKAVELEPACLIHHLALARALLDMGRAEEARTQLREVLERPVVEPTDPLHQQEAQELLSGHGRLSGRGLSP